MCQNRTRLAVFPGTFDPVTNGHLDIIRRGAALFDQTIVALGENPAKAANGVPAALRAELVGKAVAGMGNVRVEIYSGLTIQFAARAGACAILRGLRGPADLTFESQVALTNRQVSGVETVFVLPAPRYWYISSTLVRQIAAGGGDVCELVPAEVLDDVRRLYGGKG
jgi:pantetheine-phosphate adenylyltransferase